MTDAVAVETWPARLVIEGTSQSLPDAVVVEEPLEIRLRTPGGRALPLAIAMRTPGEDRELAAGFLYAEGVIAGRGDLVALREVSQRGGGAGGASGAGVDSASPWGRDQRIEVEVGGGVDLAAARAAQRDFFSSSACGVCGKAAVDALVLRGLPLADRDAPRIDGGFLEGLPAAMRAAQRVFSKTGGLHAAALFDPDGALIALREDVGRHNAVDKVVGERLLAGALPLRHAVLVVSGRVGFEIAQKAARAGIPILAAVGAPTSLSLRVAERCGMTVVGFLRPGRFNLYTGAQRIRS